MIIDEIGPQAVAHESGGIVASIDRFTLIYARGGKTWQVRIEPLSTYYIRWPARPTWNDGTLLTAEEIEQSRRDIADTCAHWGLPCDIVDPGDPRVLANLDELVTYIRSQRVGTAS